MMIIELPAIDRDKGLQGLQHNPLMQLPAVNQDLDEFPTIQLQFVDQPGWNDRRNLLIPGVPSCAAQNPPPDAIRFVKSRIRYSGIFTQTVTVLTSVFHFRQKNRLATKMEPGGKT
jgi:hypothetical protein